MIRTIFLAASVFFASVDTGAAVGSSPTVLLDWRFAVDADGNPVRHGQQIGPGQAGVHRDIRLHDHSGNQLLGTAVHCPHYATYDPKEVAQPGADGFAVRTGPWSTGQGNLASLDDMTHFNTDFSVWARVKLLGKGEEGDDVILGRPRRWSLERKAKTHRLVVHFGGRLSDIIPLDRPVIEDGKWYDVGFSFRGTGDDRESDTVCVYLNGKLIDVIEGVAQFDTQDFFHVGASGMNRLAADALFDRVVFWKGVADERVFAALSGLPEQDIINADDTRFAAFGALRRNLANVLAGYYFQPQPTPLFQLVEKTLSPEARTYLARLNEFDVRGSQLEERLAAGTSIEKEVVQAFCTEMDSFWKQQVNRLGPIAFFTRHPLSRPNAANCYIWQSVPEDWGCAIKILDPGHPDETPKTIFQDPDGSIFDMNLSFDGTTLFFSFRKKEEPYWQIYEIGIDGQGLRKISRCPQYHDTSANELPNGDLVFISTRREGFTVCQPGPTSNVHLMNRDGTNVRCVSQNTLADFSPHLLPDGRVLFTRWEYVDRDLTYRQSLWTQNPDGRQYQLFFGNTIREVATFWQTRPVPGQGNLLVATFAPHHGWPHGAIGLIDNRLGVEATRDVGYTWLTRQYTHIADRSYRWSYRDPTPVNDYQFLVTYGGGSSNNAPGKFVLYLLDLCGNRLFVHEDPEMGCYNPLLVQPREIPPTLTTTQQELASREEDLAWGTAFVADVYRGLSGIERGRVKYIQIMEQLPKLSDLKQRAYDQFPLMSYGTYYAKKCWGRVPVEADGSAHFQVPALREVYFQVLDSEGRELQRMTSAVQIMPGERRGCIGCHEPRNTAPPTVSENVPLALYRAPDRPKLPHWGNDGVVDFAKVVQPVLDKYCVECHSGVNPDGGYDFSGDKTRFFNMAYDNLLGRSQSYRQHDMRTGEMLPEERAKQRPLIHFYWLLRTPTAVNQPLLTGSHASRLLDYIDTDHCGQKIPLENRQTIYTWIDANVPYYSSYAPSRPQSPGGRDLCTDPVTGKESDWFAQQFLTVYQNRCASCHGSFPLPNDHQHIWTGRFAWLNFSHPEWSLALTAHLAKEAGGRGLKIENGDGGQTLFLDKQDPDWVNMFEAIQEGHRQMLAHPRKDMPE